MANTIDKHPERNKIIDMLVGGASVRAVAGKFGMNHQTVQNYRTKVVAPAAKLLRPEAQAIPRNPKKAELVMAPDAKPLQPPTKRQVDKRVATAIAERSVVADRIEYIWETTKDTLEQAKGAVRTVKDRDTGEEVVIGRDFACVAPLLAQANANTRLLAEMTGELKAPINNTQILIVCPTNPDYDRSVPLDQIDDGSVVINVKPIS